MSKLLRDFKDLVYSFLFSFHKYLFIFFFCIPQAVRLIRFAVEMAAACLNTSSAMQLYRAKTEPMNRRLRVKRRKRRLLHLFVLSDVRMVAVDPRPFPVQDVTVAEIIRMRNVAKFVVSIC